MRCRCWKEGMEEEGVEKGEGGGRNKVGRGGGGLKAMLPFQDPRPGLLVPKPRNEWTAGKRRGEGGKEEDMMEMRNVALLMRNVATA